MTARIKDIIAALDMEAPFSLAEEWDNVGLLVGSPEREVRSILIGLDATTSLVDEAIALSADTIITHHPVIFRPLAAINTAIPEGRLLEKALSHKIAIIGCHTNLDSASEGVSDILATALELQDLVPLIPSSAAAVDSTATGIGRIGSYPVPVAIESFLGKVMEVLNLPTIQLTGPMPETVLKVAVCGGSGSDFAETAYQAGADIYLSAEIKHNVARWAEERDFCIIDGSHYSTEQAAVGLLAGKLETMSRSNNWSLQITQTQTEKHPFVYIHKEHLK